MSNKSFQFFLPTIVGLTVYYIINIINRQFPEKPESSETDPFKNLRGGENIKISLTRGIFERISKDKALKMVLVSMFATSGIQHFTEEIEALLINNIFNHIFIRDVDVKLKVVSDMIKEHELQIHLQSIKSLLVSNNISRE